MKLILPVLLHGLILLAGVIRGGAAEAALAEAEEVDRGLRGTAAVARCLKAGKKCQRNAACCSRKCAKGGVCAAPAAPAKNVTTAPCEVADKGQCNGAGYKGCKTCAKGSGCVYSTKDLSVCLPGYSAVADRCAVADGAQCGGQGYSGCQNCKAGSKCVELSPLNSVCYAGGKVPDEAAPMIDDNSLMDVGSWVKGIDPKLDDDLDVLRRRRLQGSNGTNAESVDFDELRQRISKAFATDDGRRMAEKLMQTDEAFQKFNNESAAELQDLFCGAIESSTSLVPPDVRDCICGRADTPFVFCAALLEQTLNGHLERRRALKQIRREPSPVSRQLPSCSITLEGVGKKDKFMRYAAAVSEQVSDMTPYSSEGGAGDFCAGGECSVPLAPLPLEAVIGVEACAPTPGLLKSDIKEITELDVRRAAASKTAVNIYAKICLSGSEELGTAVDVLEFLGLDLCPIQFTGTIRPLMGVLEGEAKAVLLIVYVKGNVMLQYETETRNALALCDGVQCSNGENEDCAMCAGDMYATVEFGIKFLFMNFKKTLAQSDIIQNCTSTTTNGQCESFLGDSDTADWEDGKICGLGTTCNQCANPATYWGSKAFTACGSEPCWADGTVCGAGTTCSKCCNPARNALGTKCGGAAWADGTLCGLRTTCSLCQNRATYWVSKAFTACGAEPCWADGTVCGVGTTCSKCCNPARDALGTKCGGAAWRDGTLCGAGTTCNLCQNRASYWFSKAFTACGSEP
jgi:Fungal cellulose binding domain